MEFDRDRRVPIELNITPLIDIVFLLLIFFLLTTHFFMEEGLKVELPSSRTGLGIEQSEIIVYLDEEDRIQLNDAPVPWEELGPRLRVLLAVDPRPLVVVKADRRVPLEKAVALIDTVKEAGAEKLVLATDSPRRNPLSGTETKQEMP